MAKNLRELFTIAETASQLKVGEQTVRQWIKSGMIPAIRVGKRFRVDRFDLDLFLARGKLKSFSEVSTSLPVEAHVAATALQKEVATLQSCKKTDHPELEKLTTQLQVLRKEVKTLTTELARTREIHGYDLQKLNDLGKLLRNSNGIVDADNIRNILEQKNV